MPATKNIAVIARVPFDEGSLTGTLTAESTLARRGLPEHLLPPENLQPTLERVDAAAAGGPAGMTLPELALRHILQHPAVSTVIPGMRKLQHVEAEHRGERRPEAAGRRSWQSSGGTAGTGGSISSNSDAGPTVSS